MDISEDALQTHHPQAFVPLTPAVFHILLALGKADLYGLLIMQEVESLTHQQVRLGPGTLYRSLQRMVLDGLIEERSDVNHATARDERRRVYRLTPFGHQVAHLEAQRLATLVEAAMARGFLSDREDKS